MARGYSIIYNYNYIWYDETVVLLTPDYNVIYRISPSMAIMVNDNNICDLPKWVPVTTDHSTTLIINLAVAGSNVPLGIFAFLSNLAITVTALQRPSSIFLCSFTTSDCVVGLVAQPLFFTWWMFIQRAQDY